MTSTTSTATLPQRVFGKTGELIPVLGLGTAPGGMGLDDADAIELFEAAIDLGVTYIDCAPGYDNAHRQLSHIVPRRRDEIFLVSKAPTERRQEALDMVEANLRDLKTDALDLVYVHSIGHQHPEKVLAADGSLAGLRDAQQRGWVRYVGFTSHKKPEWSERLIKEVEVDACMFALNFADHFTYGFDRTVLPLAVERNVGIAAMKAFGGARNMEYHTTDDEKDRPSCFREHGFDRFDLCLRWVLSLEGVATAVIGVYNLNELEQCIAWTKGWKPLTPEEEGLLESEGQRLAKALGRHFD
ncbi:MAG: aldo/keto reductase [Candidatus Latescibacterota bacterium]|nr:aldo/keto reductase [Candidatus Latescibacterota bacterium]